MELLKGKLSTLNVKILYKNFHYIFSIMKIKLAEILKFLWFIYIQKIILKNVICRKLKKLYVQFLKNIF